MRLRSTVGVAEQETGFDSAAHASGQPQIFAPGDDRIDPLVVAAFNPDAVYASNAGIVAGRIAQLHEERSDRRMRSCALIGLDCDEELAVLAANVAVAMAGQVPVLLLDGNPGHPRIHQLFRVSPIVGTATGEELDGSRSAVAGAVATAVPQLWVVPADADGALPAGIDVRVPLRERVRSWNVPSTQLIAAVSLRWYGSTTAAATLVEGFDSAVIVARKHVTTVMDVRGLIDSLDERDMTIAGIVLV